MIEATAGATSHINIQSNYIHDNESGIEASNLGDFTHDNWTVAKNVVVNNGLIGIRLANVTDSQVLENFVRDHGLWGIIVSARNGLGDHVSPVTSRVRVLNNDVSGADGSAAIVVAATEFQPAPVPGLPPSINGTARVTDVIVAGNHVHDNGQAGLGLEAFNPGAVVDHVKVVGNIAVSNGLGVRLRAFGGSGPGNLNDNRIQDNVATDNGGDGYNNVSGPNVYQNNQCQFNGAGGSSPAGLCMPQ